MQIRVLALLACLPGVLLTMRGPLVRAQAPAQAAHDPARAVRADEKEITLNGVIHGSQDRGYVEVPFYVAPGTLQMTVHFSYTGRDQKATLDLGLMDPDRFRGWSGGNKREFTLSETNATPSYLAGPLVPGEWELLLGVAHIRPENAVNYVARISFRQRSGTDSDSLPQPESFTSHPLETGARWFRGDLHLHTAHSDGTCASQAGVNVPCPVFVSVAEAARHGLDFLAITDHNTTSHYDAERELQPYFDKLLLIPGREMTTYGGHANIWGTTSFIDFRAGAVNVESRNQMLSRAHALGALTSINHPVGPPAEQCIGCGWDAQDQGGKTDFSLVNAIEVFNSPETSPSVIFQASDIAFWESLLARGYHLTAVGGSDTHRPDEDTIGLPTTVVYATELSVPAILAGIQAGHVFIDLTGSRHQSAGHLRGIELGAESDGQGAKAGDTLAGHAGKPIRITATVANCPGARLHLLLDGLPIPQLEDVTLSSEEQTVSRSWTPVLAAGKPHWIRAEIRSPDGSLLLFSNPVYLTPASSGQP